MTQQQLVKMWKNFAEKYPIISLEDGMAEEDWEGWEMLDVYKRQHLHYVEGYRTEDIAPLVGCRPATVRTRLHRARKQLKLDLEGMDDEEEQPERMGADEKHKSAGGAEAAYPGGRA